MLKVLVTGGAGFVGTTLVPLLLERGYYVRILDNLMYGGEHMLNILLHDNCEMMVGNICNKETVKEALKGIDFIVHLAAVVGFPACKKSPYLAENVNVNGTANINTLRSKDQPVIYSSTGSNYGDLEDQICTEDTKLKPITLYGVTKTKAEQIIRKKKNYIIYRFATGFGVSPRLRLDLLINDFVYQALKNKNLIIYEKSFKRSFIYVKDMALGIIFGIDHFNTMKEEIYNVGDESLNFTKEEVALEIQKKIDYYLHFAEIGEDLDKRNYTVSYEKIRKIGFSTSITLDKGIDYLKKGLSVLQIRNRHSNI